MLLLCIALGGAIGALARYGLGGWIHSWAGTGFPWGTLVINISGSLVLGFSARFLEALAATAELRALITIGFLGAFTTFSTFSYETAAMLQDGQWTRAATYVFASVFLSLAGTFAGFAVATVALQPRG